MQLFGCLLGAIVLHQSVTGRLLVTESFRQSQLTLGLCALQITWFQPAPQFNPMLFSSKAPLSLQTLKICR